MMGRIVLEILNLIILFDDQLWLCAKKNVESRRYLNDILPPDFMYKVTAYSIIEESNIVCETKFTETLLANICSKEGFDDFLAKFRDLSKAEHNIEDGDRKNGKYYQIAESRKCSHDVRTKFNPATNEDTHQRRPGGPHADCRGN